MTEHLPNIWKALGLICAGGVPSSLIIDSGMPYLEKYGITGLLLFGLMFCYFQWMKADKAKEKEHLARIAEIKANAERIEVMHKMTIANLETDLKVERQRPTKIS